MSSPVIRAFAPADVASFRRHFARHCAESGAGEPPFMPFVPGGSQVPAGLDERACERPVGETGWQRWFLAWDGTSGEVVGHVNLKGDGLQAAAHRCSLAIGIERGERRRGLGQRLLQAALAYAREAPSLDWVDLSVFAHNSRAIALYRRLGFVETGRIVERFIIGEWVVDDVLMTLRVVAAEGSGVIGTHGAR